MRDGGVKPECSNSSHCALGLLLRACGCGGARSYASDPARVTDRHSRVAEGYLDETFAPDLTDPAEQNFTAKDVERLMRGLEYEMGFEGGVVSPENG